MPAQFGTIGDWLNYDRIRMASAKRNLLGEGIGEVFDGIAQIVEDRAGDISGKKEEKEPVNLLERLEKSAPSVNIADPNTPNFGRKEIPEYKVKPRNLNTPEAIGEQPPQQLPPPAELAKTNPVDLSATALTPTDRTFDLYDYSTQNYQGVSDISESTKNAAAKKKNIAANEQAKLMQFLLPAQETYGPSPLDRRRRGRMLGVQGGTLIETAEREQQNYQQRRYNPDQDPYLDEQGRAEMISSPGFIGSAGAFAEGYNMRIKRRSYARQAWEKSQKGLEDVFSQLDAPPSGVDSIDGSMAIMGNQAKKAFVELEKNKYGMDPAEYNMAKSSILAQPKLIGESMKILKERIAAFADNRHLLSKGNNAETLDILDTLSKNEGSLQPVMKNGIAYLAGKTAGGRDVSVALSEIVNGRNDFKFLTRFDPTETLDKMVTKYSKIKKDAEFRTSTGAGVESRTLPISAFEKDIKADFRKMLADESTLRSVVADYLDADYDTFEEIKAAGLDPKTLAINELYNQFATKYDPVSQQRDIQSYTTIDPEARAIKLQGLKDKASGGGKAGLDSLSQTFSDPNFYASFESNEGITPGVIKATIGANAVVDEDDPNFLVIQDPGAPNQEIRIPRKGGSNRQKAIDILARQIFKADPAKIKLTPTVSQGGPLPYSLPKQ